MELMGVYNLKHLKAARIYQKDLELLFYNLQSEINYLNGFKHYKSIARILITLKEEFKTIEKHLKQCKDIVENKGLSKDG